MIINKYYGPTNSVPGGTFLATKTYASVEEGYTYNLDGVGVTTEYAKVGDFELASIQNKGPFNQVLSLNLDRDFNRLRYNNSFFPRTLINGQDYYDDFNSNSGKWNAFGTWGITTGAAITFVTNYAENTLDLALTRPLENFSVITKLKGSLLRNGELCHVGVGFGVRSPANSGSTSTTKFEVYLGANGQTTGVVLSTFGGASAASSNTLLALSENTYYWLMVVVNQGSIRGYLSTDGAAYTKYIDSSTRFSTLGSIQLIAYADPLGGTYTFDSVEVAELGPQYTVEDTLRETLTMGGVYNVKVQDEIAGISNFSMNNGSSWVYGTSDNVFENNTGTGTSWNILWTQGTTFNNFVMEVEAKSGLTRGDLALAVGTTDTFYLGYNFNGPSYETWQRNAGSLVRTNINKNGDLPVVQTEKWYKFKLVKSGTFLGWYVNDRLMVSTQGLSFIDQNNVALGLGSWRGRTSGCTVEYRKFRISKLDDSVDDVVINPNDNLQDILLRYLPQGFNMTNSDGVHEIFELGSSRGIHTVGLSDYTAGSDKSADNSSPNDLIVVQGNNNIYLNYSGNPAISSRADSVQVDYTSDQNVQNVTDAKRLANGNIVPVNKATQLHTLTMHNRPMLDVGDAVVFTDDKLGVSDIFMVYNKQGSFDAATGLFTNALQLGYGPTNL